MSDQPLRGRSVPEPAPPSAYETSKHVQQRGRWESQVYQPGVSNTSESQTKNSGEATSSRRYETVETRDVERTAQANTRVPRQQYVDQPLAPGAIPRKAVSRRENESRRWVGASEASVELQGSLGPNVETAAVEDEHDGVESDSSIDSLEAKLAEHRKAEVKKTMEKGDWEGAERMSQEILESFDGNQTTEIAEWEERLAGVLLRQGKAQGALDALARQKSRSPGAQMSANAMRMWAEAHYYLDNMDEAMKSCASAIKATRKSKTPEMLGIRQHSMFLMSEILEAMGRKVDASFYRGQIGENYVPELSRATHGPVATGESEQETQRYTAKLIQDTEEKEETKITLSAEALKLMDEYHLQLGPTGTLLTEHSDNMLSAFKVSLRGGNYDLVALLLKVPNFHTFTRNGYGALGLAAIRVHIDSIRTLLEAGADPNFANGATPENAYSALHLLARNSGTPGTVADAVTVADLLISYGADVNYRDKYRETPLHAAARAGNLGVVRLLLNSGVDVTSANLWGQVASQVVRDNTNNAIWHLLKHEEMKPNR